MYEAELERVKRMYEARAEVYDAFEQWTSLWDERLNFEARANDPDRYKSRTLQKEIQVRVKRITSTPECSTQREQLVERKLLPLAYDAVKKATDKWKRTHAEPILVNGLDPIAAIEDKISKHETDKALARVRYMHMKFKLYTNLICSKCAHVEVHRARLSRRQHSVSRPVAQRSHHRLLNPFREWAQLLRARPVLIGPSARR